jgi:hypothetical protein
MRFVRPSISYCLVAAGLLSGCGGSTGSGTANGDANATCAALGRMAKHAPAVEHADVSDPDNFARTFDRALKQYTDDLRKLRKVAPTSLHDPIDAIDAAVAQHDFQGALLARGALDDYAATTCRPATSAAAR